MSSYAERQIHATRDEIKNALALRVSAIFTGLGLTVPDTFLLPDEWAPVGPLLEEQKRYEYHKRRVEVLARHRVCESETHRLIEHWVIADLVSKGATQTRAEKEVDRDTLWQTSNASLVAAREAERMAETELSIARERLRTARAIVTGTEDHDEG